MKRIYLFFLGFAAFLAALLPTAFVPLTSSAQELPSSMTIPITEVPTTGLPVPGLPILPLQLPGFPNTIPSTVQTCLPDLAANTVTYEAQTTAADGRQYLSVLVQPLNAGVGDRDYDYTQDIGDWRLVIAYDTTQCQAQNNAADPTAHSVEPEARDSLERNRVQSLIGRLGGVDNFLDQLLNYTGDENHGGDRPEIPTVSSDMVRILQQLGIQIPPGVQID